MRPTGPRFGTYEKRPAVWRPHNSVWVVPMLAEFRQTDCRKDTGIGGTYDLQVGEKAIMTSPWIGVRRWYLGIAIHVSEHCSVVRPRQKPSVLADNFFSSGFVLG